MFCTAEDKEIRQFVKKAAAKEPLTQEQMDALLEANLENAVARWEEEQAGIY
jgi:hypothetical protein